MEAQELVNALKRRGYNIGRLGISADGPLLDVNGRMMKLADAEKLLNANDEELLSSIDILVRQAEQLIEKFAIEITHADAPTYGSDRYRKTAHSLNRLNRAEVQLGQSGRAADWERTTVDGREGSEIFGRLLPIKDLFEAMDEGAPRPKAVGSN
jgi:hypothetical protein